MFYIYKLSSSRDEEKTRYIGYSENTEKRLEEHLKDVNRSKISTYKKNWIKKELRDGFKIILDVIDERKTIDDIKKLEMDTIKLFKSFGARLVNGTLGGDGVRYTEATRLKMCAAQKNKVNSPETRIKISESNKGKIISEATREKMRLKMKGRNTRGEWTKEQKEAMSLMKKGNSNRKGYKTSEETKLKIKISKTGVESSKAIPILQYDLEDNFIREWRSISEAVKNTPNAKNIYGCVKGKRNKSGNFKWKLK